MNVFANDSATKSFKGKIMVQGSSTPQLTETVCNNPGLKKLSSSKYNIIAKFDKKYAPNNDWHHVVGTPIYKLTLVSSPEKPNFLDRVKQKFGILPKIKVTKHYHDEYSLIKIINRKIHTDKYAKKLNINL